MNISGIFIKGSIIEIEYFFNFNIMDGSSSILGLESGSNLIIHTNQGLNFSRERFREVYEEIKKRINFIISSANSTTQDRDFCHRFNHFLNNQVFIGDFEEDLVKDEDFKKAIMNTRNFVINKVFPLISELGLPDLLEEIRYYALEEKLKVDDELIRNFFEFMTNGLEN